MEKGAGECAGSLVSRGDHSSGGTLNAYEIILKKREGRELSVVGDQVGSPTWAANLARYTVAALHAGLPARAIDVEPQV